MTDAPTLKPCPFCGGKATYRVDHTTEHVDSISCRQCDFYMSDQGIVQGSVRDTWNRRALPLPDDAEMVERVGRRLCAEKCAFYGDPPCWKMAEDEGLDWAGGAATAARCDEDCIALARAAISAMRGES